MHKHKTVKMQPLFRREKDLTKLLSQKDGLDKIKEFAAITTKLQNTATEAKDLVDWQTKCISILPASYKENKEFLTDFSNLVAKYEISDTEPGNDA